MNYTPPIFKPIVYVPSSQQEFMLARTIQTIQVCALTKEYDEIRKDVQHWIISLKTAEAESVTIDMQPSHSQPSTELVNGSKGIIVVSLLASSIAPNVVHSIHITPSQAGITVGNLIEKLKQSGREKYEFSSKGTGCRKWVCETMEMLDDLGYITNVAATSSKSDVGLMWPDNSASPIDKGAYYV